MGFLDFALKAMELKDIERTGWLVRKVERPESVGDHTFSLALLCALYAEDEGLDPGKCARLALVHDLHETVCGDICTRESECEQKMSNAEKRKAEEKAIKELLKFAPAGKRQELGRLASEFMEQTTKEAVFVKDLDMVEMCIQVLYYKKHGRVKADMGDFFRRTDKALKTKTGRRLFVPANSLFNKLIKLAGSNAGSNVIHSGI